MRFSSLLALLVMLGLAGCSRQNGAEAVTGELLIKAQENDSVKSLTAGYHHNCAVVGSGHVYCWGSNSFGQLGVELLEDSPYPVRVTLPEPAAEVAAGRDFTCVVSEARNVFCWGKIQLPSRSGPLWKPFQLAGIRAVLALAAGTEHMCVLLQSEITCFGKNRSGELGVLPGSSQPGRVKVEATKVYAGSNVTCAIANAKVLCWGTNKNGELALVGVASSAKPVSIELPFGVETLAAGWNICASAKNANGVFCWGSNVSPVKVNGFPSVSRLDAYDAQIGRA